MREEGRIGTSSHASPIPEHYLRGGATSAHPFLPFLALEDRPQFDIIPVLLRYNLITFSQVFCIAFDGNSFHVGMLFYANLLT